MRIFLAEWRKLRRPTLFLGTIGAVLFFSGLVSSLLYLLIDSPNGNGDRGIRITRDVLAMSDGSVCGFSSVGGLLGIIALCVFAAQTSQEYTYGTLRNLLVRQPRRIQLLLGKLVAMKIFALIMTIFSAIISIGLSTVLAPTKDITTQLWFEADGRAAIARTFLNVFISVIYFGIAGMALGLLLRSPISSISFGVLWILIIENIIGALKSSTLDWFPGNQFSVIASGGTPNVSYSHALTLGSAYVLLFGIISTVLFVRRDVAN